MPRNKGSSNLKKIAYNRDLLGFDLLFQLSYMSAVAAAGIPRGKIFQMASNLPNTVAPFFHKIYVLSEKMGYDYSEACRLVGEEATDNRIKSLLLRVSSSLAAGEAEPDFLEREARVQADSYGNEYEGKLETLRKWTDAYTALAISAALVIVVAVVSMLIYSVSTTFILSLTVLSVSVTCAGVWIIHRSAPSERKVLEGAVSARKARMLDKLFIIVVPLSLALAALIAVLGLPMGWLLIAASIPLVPLGLLATSFDKDIDNKDREVSTFLRALGSVASAIGSTLTEGMERLDMRSFVALGLQIKELHGRLKARIDPSLCWRRLVSDSGSILIDRSIAVFQDAINHGGDAEEVGARSSLMAMKVSFLRAKRRLVSNTFGWLTIAMHATIAGLLVFIISVVNVFAGLVKGTQNGQMEGVLPFFTFKSGDMQLFQMLLVPLLVVFSIANASAPQAAEGGHKYRFFLFLGIMLAISGATLIIVPAATELLFNITPGTK